MLMEQYRQKLRTPEEAVKVVKSGDWVDYTTNVGFPPLLDAALAKRTDELTDVYADSVIYTDPSPTGMGVQITSPVSGCHNENTSTITAGTAPLMSGSCATRVFATTSP